MYDDNMKLGAVKGYQAMGQLAGIQAMDIGPATKASRESDTNRELEILEKEIEGLSAALGYLRERIEPVCRPAIPTPGTNGQVAPERPVAPLANHLRMLRNRLSSMREAMIALNDRIDL